MGKKLNQYDFAIISAELSHLGAEVNAERTKELQHALEVRGIGFKPLKGKYKGTTESSFIVEMRSVVEDIAASFEQESILVLDPWNNAKLVFTNSEQVENIGKLIKVTSDEALALDAWSYRPDLNQYYAVKG